MQKGTENDLIRMDSVAFPLALFVLALMLRSFRLLLIPIINIVVALVSTFLIMYPIAMTLDVISFAPSVVMSCSIAFSIDYSLFLLSRFREEVLRARRAPRSAGGTPEWSRHYVAPQRRPIAVVRPAVELMLASAGHTVLVSGLTLALCWACLMFFPISLLSTIGMAAAINMVMCLLVNLTLAPCLLLQFPAFFAASRGCGLAGCCTRRCIRGEPEGDHTYAPLSDAPGLGEALVSAGEWGGRGGGGGGGGGGGNDAAKDASSLQPFSCEFDSFGNPRRAGAGGGGGGGTAAADKSTSGSPGGVVSRAAYEAEMREVSKSCWFRCGNCLLRSRLQACFVACIVVACAAPLAFYAVNFHRSSSFALYLPRSMPASKAFKDLNLEFGAGRLNPYQLLVGRADGGAIVSKDCLPSAVGGVNDPGCERFFNATAATVVALLNMDDAPGLEASGVQGVVFMDSAPVRFKADGFSLETCLVAAAVKQPLPAKEQEACRGLEIIAGVQINNQDGLLALLTPNSSHAPPNATFVQLSLTVDPNGPAGSTWIQAARKVLEERAKTDGNQYWLTAGNSVGEDAVNSVFDLFPVAMCGDDGVNAKE